MSSHLKINRLRPILALRLLVVVCTLSFIITLTISAIRLYYDYHVARIDVNEHVNIAGKSAQESAAEGLWRLDGRILQLEMQSILALPDITFAEVREATDDPQPLVLFAGKRASAGYVEQVFPLFRNVQGSVIRIGTLSVQASLTNLRNKTIGTAVSILVNQAISTFFVALLTIYILNRLVTRHLTDIAREISVYNFRQKPLPLSLKRRSSRNDELRQVVDSFNEMSERLYNAFVSERNAEIERDEERSISAAKLASSEQRLRTILESSPIPMCVTRIDSGHFLYTNEPFRKLFDFAEGDAWPAIAGDLYVHAIDRDNYLCTLRECGGVNNMELQLRKRDGSTFWAILTTTSTIFENQPAAFACMNNITERKALEIELFDSREQLRRLSCHMESVREEERKHIALEIHDQLGQLLTALKMKVSLTKMTLSLSPPLLANLNEMQSLIEETMSIVRNVASHLRPASLNLGIVPALEWLSSDFSKRHLTPCRFYFSGEEPTLENSVSTALFRITQESLTNAARHANASTIDVHLLCTPTSVELCIKDDGSGFDVGRAYGQHPFGLIGMEERARLIGAIYIIESAKGSGTKISVVLSL